MQQALLVVQVLAAVGLIVLVMLQQGRGADAGAAFGSGGAGTLFGARGPATVLTRATAVLAAVFFVNSLALSYFAGQSVERRSIVERFPEEAPLSVPVGTGVPAAPGDVPAAPGDVPTVPGAGPAVGEDDTASDVPVMPDQSTGQAEEQSSN